MVLDTGGRRAAPWSQGERIKGMIWVGIERWVGLELERKQCSNQSLGGFDHHGTYEQGTPKVAPVDSPRDTLPTFMTRKLLSLDNVLWLVNLSSQTKGGGGGSVPTSQDVLDVAVGVPQRASSADQMTYIMIRISHGYLKKGPNYDHHHNRDIWGRGYALLNGPVGVPPQGSALQIRLYISWLIMIRVGSVRPAGRSHDWYISWYHDEGWTRHRHWQLHPGNC